MKRAFDIAFVLAFGCILLPVAIVVAVAVRLTDYGPVLFWSDRVGRDEKIFKMPKFRTMRANAPQLPTHKMTDARQWLTPIGAFLRRSSLDEIPQLWSILVGDMSVIGPRPALFNQDDLIALRREAGVNAQRPGLTGWAQVNGRDTLPIPEKVKLEGYYLKKRGFRLDCRILWLTFWRVLARKDVSH